MRRINIAQLKANVLTGINGVYKGKALDLDDEELLDTIRRNPKEWPVDVRQYAAAVEVDKIIASKNAIKQRLQRERMALTYTNNPNASWQDIMEAKNFKRFIHSFHRARPEVARNMMYQYSRARFIALQPDPKWFNEYMVRIFDIIKSRDSRE